MNFIAICLHSLDMRDFHSSMGNIPYLDKLRSESVYIPMGRGQGHHAGDSLNAELTGIWTARFSNSVLDRTGYRAPNKCWLAKTVIEGLQEDGYNIFTCITYNPRFGTGTSAVQVGMQKVWLKDEPERLKQFSWPEKLSLSEWLTRIGKSRNFYAHIFLRQTHRPWDQVGKLCALMDMKTRVKGLFRKRDWPYDAYCARIAALEKPGEFSALRREGLARADRTIAEIMEATKTMEDTTYVIYSNHGEVFDHFRYNQAYTHSTVDGLQMIEGTSHGNYPYEVLYANMQMWKIPNQSPKVMRGIGRSIDFAPTILDLAGIRPKFMDGESMLDYFAEGAFPERTRYAETPIGGGCLSMVREDRYKLIAVGDTGKGEDNIHAQRGFANHRLAVFDLNSDPYEYVNVINTEHGLDVLNWAISKHRELKDMKKC